MRRSRLLPILLLIATALPAQDVVTAGQRVRVRPAAGAPFTGTFRQMRPDTAVIDADDGRRERLPVAGITRVEVSRGRSAAAGAPKGALWGGAIGGGLLMLGGGAEMDAGTAVAAVGTYAALGAAIGAVRRPERWDAARWPGPDTIDAPTSVAPAAASAAASAMAAEPAAPLESAQQPQLPQTSALFRVGERVRVKVGDGPWGDGVVAGASADSLWLARGGAPAVLAVADLSAAERYRGRTARGGAKASLPYGRAIGTAGGLLIGTMLGAMFAAFANEDPTFSNVAPVALLVGGTGWFAGGAVAAVIGAAIGGDDWEPIELRERR